MNYLSDNAWRRPIEFIGGPRDGQWLSIRPQTYHIVFPGLPRQAKICWPPDEHRRRADFIYYQYSLECVGDQVVFRYQGVS